MASPITLTRRLKKAGVRVLAAVVPAIYVAYMRLVYLTSRVDADEAVGVLTRRRDAGDNVVAASLHQGIFLIPYVLRELRAVAFTNVGDAGDLMAALLGRCNFQVVRGGSSSRASRQTPVVGRIIEAVRSRPSTEGCIVGSAPDGSSGPAGAINAGLVLFSIRLNADIYCVHIQSKRSIHLNTWDRTAIPLPFNRIRVRVKGPFRINGKPTRNAMEAARLQIEDAFHELHTEGFTSFGQTPVPTLSRVAPRRQRGQQRMEEQT
jgi:lysophospholipid acyltransferase (LPLAT)-like uncharacterized protein